jgi:hypothetical protein
VIGTDCTVSFKPNYHTKFCEFKYLIIIAPLPDKTNQKVEVIKTKIQKKIKPVCNLPHHERDLKLQL